MKKALKKIDFVLKAYRNFIYPTRKQSEPDIFIIRKLSFGLSIDIGANIGVYTVELSKVSNKVIAFEPLDDTFKVLKTVSPSKVSLHKCALGEQNEEGIIYVPLVQGQKDYALASIVPHQLQGAVEEKIVISNFDNNREKFLHGTVAPPDFVKIDVEGYEQKVLHGMRKTIALHHPTFLVEVEKRHNASFAEIFSFLDGLGYQSYYTPNGIDLLRCDSCNVEEFQMSANYERDVSSMRTFSPGEVKHYINNFWFIHETKLTSFSSFFKA